MSKLDHFKPPVLTYEIGAPERAEFMVDPATGEIIPPSALIPEFPAGLGPKDAVQPYPWGTLKALARRRGLVLIYP
jgi:hypothetical protein